MGVGRLLRFLVMGRQRHAQKLARLCGARLAGRAGEQPIVADPMEAARQDVEQEAAGGRWSDR